MPSLPPTPCPVCATPYRAALLSTGKRQATCSRTCGRQLRTRNDRAERLATRQARSAPPAPALVELVATPTSAGPLDPGALVAAIATGDHLASLRALRATLAERLTEASARESAPLARQLFIVLSEIVRLSPPPPPVEPLHVTLAREHGARGAQVVEAPAPAVVDDEEGPDPDLDPTEAPEAVPSP